MAELVRTSSSGSSKLEGKELLDALKKQIEYYFSNGNLRTDSYLVSQMNSELYVPVKVIAGFNMIRSLTDDLELILTAMKECNSIRLNPDQTMVKPNIKSQRNTLILREISSDIDPSEIKALFDEQFGKVDVKSDIGDCWYVYFENDEQTMTALEYLKTKNFNDQPVKARVKTENTLKTLQAVASSNKVLDTSKPTVTTSPTQPNYFPNYGVYPQFTGFPVENFDPYRQPRQSGTRKHYQQNSQPNQQRNPGAGYRKKKDFSGQVTSQTNQQNTQQQNTQQSFQNNERGRSGRGGSNMRGRNNQNFNNNNRKKRNMPPPPPNIGEEEQFPPLISSKRSDEIKSYSRQEILDLFSQLKDVEKPSLPECEAISDKPNFELESTKPFPSTATKK